ncbi:ABC transporter, ATP-binding protein [Eubacterium nodatum ATCC 33099]|nr:ABC transporter, ATP-binding protein [Eubacterium nodatum ATCC 33099]
MFRVLIRFINFSGEKNKKRYIISILLGIVEAFGQALRIPAIYLVIRGVVNNRLTGDTVAFAMAILISGLLLQIISARTGKTLQTEAGYTTCAGKRMEIAEHLRYIPMGYFNENSLGTITSITTNTMEALADVATRVVMMTLNGLLESLLITVMLLTFDWRIGLTAIAGIIVFFIINAYMQSKSVDISETKNKADTAMIGEILEFIQGISEAKSYNLIGENNKKLEKSIEDCKNATVDMEMKFVPLMGLQTWIIKMTGIAMCVLSLKLYFNDQMDLATCIVMLLASFMIYGALETAGNFSALLRTVDICVNKANEVLAIQQMDIEGEEVVPETHNIEMENVDFAYDRRKVVDNVNLSIKERTSAAFVGPSGSGKTTICHLIARFWDVEKGRIKFDGRNVKNYSIDSLMRNFSFVFQNVYLFHDTVANNIRFGQPDASMEKVIEAAKKACCHEFIEELPEGYDTILGEGGASLSGGQKQRISIARAMMKDSPVIILDEATANVDPENEKELMEAIDELTREKTVLMIAHRLNTVRNADKIYVVDRGKIVQQGRHAELVEQEGIYKNFIASRAEAVGWKISK